MTPRLLIVYCGLLMTATAFSVDITLPFFVTISAQLDAPFHSVQMTVTAYIFAIGVGQLVFGSLSDRFGRRMAVACGLTLYIAGALLGSLAPTVEWLVAARVVQGLGGAAGPVIARAILRDQYAGMALAKNMAVASGIFALGPILAPLIGIALSDLSGSWRVVFYAMMAFGCLLLFALAAVPETLRRRDPDALSPGVFLRNIVTVFRHPQSRFFFLLCAGIMISMLSVVTILPRIFMQGFGLSGRQFGLMFAVHGTGLILGQIANHRMIGTFGIVRTAWLASMVVAVSAAAICLAGLIGISSPYPLMALTVLFAVGYMIVFSNASSMAMEPHGEIAGFTASFLGFFSQIAAAACVTLMAALVGSDIVLWGGSLTLIAAAALLALTLWLRRPLTPAAGWTPSR